MVNQVSPTVNLVPGSPLIRAAATQPRPAQEPSPPRANASVPRDTPRTSPAPADEDAMAKAVDDLNDYLRRQEAEAQNTPKKTPTSFADIVFQVDKSTGAAVFKVVDAKTKEVIRQIPSEEVLAMARKLRELSGRPDVPSILVDEEG